MPVTQLVLLSATKNPAFSERWQTLRFALGDGKAVCATCTFRRISSQDARDNVNKPPLKYVLQLLNRLHQPPRCGLGLTYDIELPLTYVNVCKDSSNSVIAPGFIFHPVTTFHSFSAQGVQQPGPIGGAPSRAGIP